MKTNDIQARARKIAAELTPAQRRAVCWHLTHPGKRLTQESLRGTSASWGVYIAPSVRTVRYECHRLGLFRFDDSSQPTDLGRAVAAVLAEQARARAILEGDVGNVVPSEQAKLEAWARAVLAEEAVDRG